jgi:hypothetical protein
VPNLRHCKRKIRCHHGVFVNGQTAITHVHVSTRRIPASEQNTTRIKTALFQHNLHRYTHKHPQTRGISCFLQGKLVAKFQLFHVTFTDRAVGMILRYSCSQFVPPVYTRRFRKTHLSCKAQRSGTHSSEGGGELQAHTNQNFKKKNCGHDDIKRFTSVSFR